VVDTRGRARDGVRRAVPRTSIAASPAYGGRGGRYANARTRRGASYGNRGDGRGPRGYSVGYGYRPYVFYPTYRHVYYPGYARPTIYGSSFYFPGYAFSVGIGSGFGHYGYSGYAYSPYGYGYGSFGGTYSDAYTGFLRLKVKPRDAQVFVDGYYVGLVDHFDGWAQRLRLEEGGHQVEVRHPAYAPLQFEVYVVTGEKVTFEEHMSPL